MTKMEMENQTEMETELEKRLDQLSDRLIQKQSQVGLPLKNATEQKVANNI